MLQMWLSCKVEDDETTAVSDVDSVDLNDEDFQ